MSMDTQFHLELFMEPACFIELTSKRTEMLYKNGYYPTTSN